MLELCPLLQGERVGLGDHRHHVDDLAEPPHELQVEGPQPERDGPSPCCPPPAAPMGARVGGTHQWPVGGTKYTQPWTLVSGIFLLRVMRISSRRYLSYCSLMYLMMGSQLVTQGRHQSAPQGGVTLSQNAATSPRPAAAPYQFSLLIWSPKPGVSVTVSFIFTPFSSMTTGQVGSGGSAHQGGFPCFSPGFKGRDRTGGLTVGDRLQLHRLGDALLLAGLRGFAAHFGLEEGVHHRGLPQPALPCGDTSSAALSPLMVFITPLPMVPT